MGLCLVLCGHEELVLQHSASLGDCRACSARASDPAILHASPRLLGVAGADGALWWWQMPLSLAGEHGIADGRMKLWPFDLIRKLL